MTFLPVAVSDAARFVILHRKSTAAFTVIWICFFFCEVFFLHFSWNHTGKKEKESRIVRVTNHQYLLQIADLRPLVIAPDHNFAERWAVHDHPWDYNTAVMSLHAHSLPLLLPSPRRRPHELQLPPRKSSAASRTRTVSRASSQCWKQASSTLFGGSSTAVGRGAAPCPAWRDYGMVFLGEKGAVRRGVGELRREADRPGSWRASVAPVRGKTGVPEATPGPRNRLARG